ncbi:MAG: CPBP family intramembrane glutamic endopeptidase [Opitutales bacterium]
METQLDGPILVASFLILSILVGSAVLWIRQARRPREAILPHVGIRSWPIGWVNFGIFICTLIFAVFLVQSIGASILFSGEAQETPELTPSLAVAAVLMLQLPMLAVFYVARRFFPAQFAGPLNDARFSQQKAFLTALPLFVMFLPVVWLTTLVWSNLLFALEQMGLVEGVEPQALVTLFADGGHPAAIFLLVVLAVVLAPLVEELIFRGCIYRFLKSKTSLLPAQVLSGAVFAMLHANLLSFVPLLLVGVLLAHIYEKSGNLWVAIWFHAFFNAFSLSILFITGLSDNLPNS